MKMSKGSVSQFCMNICSCENFFQNGCRVHLPSTKNNSALMLRRSVWAFSNETRRSFSVGTLPWTKYGCTTIRWNLSVSHLSGQRPVKAARSAQRLNNGLEKSWHPFFDYLEKGKTINSEHYIALLERLKTEVAKNGRTWRARRSCSTKKTRRVTSH